MDFFYIDNEQSLKRAAEQWQDAEVIAVDIECENNLHHYGAYITLVQLSTKKRDWIIDFLALKDTTLLKEMLEDPKVQKIFHDVSYDFRMLHHEMQCLPRNVFDTQIAAQLLGKKELGLGSLLHEYFNVDKKKRFQKADWTRRPLSRDMLAYAINDTRYLIRLRDVLIRELIEKGRLSWVQQECADLEKRDWTYREGTFFEMKGIRQLSNRQRAILRRLYNLRETLAEAADRPVYFVLSNKKLIELCMNPPTLSGWENMRGVHPIVRRYAGRFFEEVERGKREELTLPAKKKVRFFPEQKQRLQELSDRRDIVAEKVGIEKHLIISQDQMQDVALTGKFRSLRPWQRELMK